MNVSPYSTQAAGHHNTGSIQSELTKAFTMGELCYDHSLLGDKILVVVDAKDAVANIPPFTHPIEFSTVTNDKLLAIDGRPFTQARKSVNDSMAIRNRSEYTLTASRALLQAAWNERAYDDLRNISPLGIQVFARWLPQSIAGPYGLDPSSQLDLSIITAYYYLCLFEPDTKVPVNERQRYIAQVSRAVNTSFERVEEVLDGIPHLGTLTEYCKAVREKNITVRLERYEPAVVMTMVAGSWFGNKSREIVAVALEHPPTWLALLFSAITDRGYYRTSLSKLVAGGFNKGDQLRQFEINFTRCIQAWK